MPTIGELYLPNVSGNGFDAFKEGQEFGRENKRRKTLADFYQSATQGDANAQAELYKVDQNAGMQAQRFAQTQQDDARTALARDVATMKRLPTQMRDGFYQRIKPRLSQAFPGQYPDAWSSEMDPMVDQLDAALNGPEKGIEGRVVGNDLVNPYTGKVMYEGREKPQGAIFQKDAQGNGYWLRPGESPIPVEGGPQGFGQSGGGSQVLDDALASAVMQQESGGNPNAVSSAGARGLMQLMPGTQRDPGFGVQPAADNSPQENVRVGREYLNAMLGRYKGNQTLALAAYNAGPGRVDQALAQTGGDPQRAIAMLPKETQDYVQQVPARMGTQGQRINFGKSNDSESGGKAADWQIVQGQDGTFYRVNKLTGEKAGTGVQGANALRANDQHQKRADAISGIKGAITSTDQTIQQIDLLLNHPGRGSGTGLTAALPAIPGSARKGFDAQLATFKAQTFIPMVSQLKGMGALSDAEGKKLTEAVGALDPQMDEDEFAASLNRIKERLYKAQKLAYDRITQLNTNQGQRAAPAQPAAGGFRILPD